MKIKSPKMNTLLQRLIDKTSSKLLLDEMSSKTVQKEDFKIDRGK